MLVHHSLRNPDRAASGRSSGDSDKAKNMPARSQSPLKFLRRGTEPANSTDNTQDAKKRWTADYLAELRKPSGARPMGARPMGPRASMPTIGLLQRASTDLSALMPEPNLAGPVEQAKRSISPFRIPRTNSAADNRSKNAGRPLAREPDVSIMEDIAFATAKMDNVKVSIDGRDQPMPYYERGQRWMERQEAKSLRAAMDYMDMEKEKKVHAAAQEEAAELVWKHKFPEKPYENPDVWKHAIKDHLRKGSHARSQSVGPFETLYVTKGGMKDGKRVPSGESTSNNSDVSNSSRGSRVVSTSSKGSNESSESKGSTGSRRYSSLSFRNPASKLFGRRRSSRKSRKSSDGKQSGLFNNPEDKIYEEAEAVLETPKDQQNQQSVLNPKSRNISGSYRPGVTPSDFLAKTSFITENKVSSIDIHRNPPSQSRDPSYMRNDPSVQPDKVKIEAAQDEAAPAMKDGKEVRSEDIRAATRMSLKDRSEKLPTPTYVSDAPGRPIVSFDSEYKPQDPNGRSGRNSVGGARPLFGRYNSPRSSMSNTPASAAHNSNYDAMGSVATPPVPTISLPDETPSKPAPMPIPSMVLPDETPAPSNTASNKIPTISVPEINVPGGNSTRPAQPRQQLRGHWSPAASRSLGAQCHSCGHHTTGRTLSAAGQRFHPECFNCFACGTNLEHVAFYPEPENAREERLASEFGASTPDSHDARFFCHLDFHENFSPRCKSCKTPIEGEVVLACGSHWHQGHFFCAQCGDPFDGEKPFIEKDGWAWCVGCYKGRYSGKCRGCKKPVIDDGVMAMGAEWHVDCFRCKECNGPFEDGRFFTRGEGTDPVCVMCEERRLKA